MVKQELAPPEHAFRWRDALRCVRPSTPSPSRYVDFDFDLLRQIRFRYVDWLRHLRHYSFIPWNAKLIPLGFAIHPGGAVLSFDPLEGLDAGTLFLDAAPGDFFTVLFKLIKLGIMLAVFRWR